MLVDRFHFGDTIQQKMLKGVYLVKFELLKRSYKHCRHYLKNRQLFDPKVPGWPNFILWNSTCQKRIRLKFSCKSWTIVKPFSPPKRFFVEKLYRFFSSIWASDEIQLSATQDAVLATDVRIIVNAPAEPLNQLTFICAARRRLVHVIRS